MFFVNDAGRKKLKDCNSFEDALSTAISFEKKGYANLKISYIDSNGNERFI